MYYKIIGASLIIVGCGGVGFLLAFFYRREEQTLRQLIHLLDFMECELQFRLTPLPDLCRQAAAEAAGVMRQLFIRLSRELEDQISPDVCMCMNAALEEQKDIPQITKRCLKNLGRSLGRFDLTGQLRGLEAVRTSCRKELDTLQENRDVRLRSYQTLGLCAGAALAILFI